LHRVPLLNDGTALAEGLPQSVLVPERLAKAYGFRTTVGQIDDGLRVFPVEPIA
jgi:ABC-type hemin transport system ATPase subunit